MKRQGPCPFCGQHKIAGRNYAEFCDSWRRYYCDRELVRKYTIRGQYLRALRDARVGARRRFA